MEKMINIEEIMKHIRQDDIWDDQCFYLNNEPELQAILKYYYYYKLKWCGCGCPEDAMRTVAKYLKAKSYKYPENDKKMKEFFDGKDEDDDLILCLAYTMDAAGFTEHGSSIYSCWLTDDGKYFLWAIEEAIKQDELEF